MWVWIAVAAIALIILVTAAVRLLGRLQRRQEEAMRLQAGAAKLEQTMLGLQQRAEKAQEQVERIQAGFGK